MPKIRPCGSQRALRKEEFGRRLIPENRVHPTIAIEVAELDFVLTLAAFIAVLDQMPFPGELQIEIGVRIFPPPNLHGAPVAANGKIEITVIIHIREITASLGEADVGINEVFISATGSMAKPLDFVVSLFTPASDDKVIRAIVINIEKECGTLPTDVGGEQVSSFARKVCPLRQSGSICVRDRSRHEINACKDKQREERA